MLEFKEKKLGKKEEKKKGNKGRKGGSVEGKNEERQKGK